MPLHGKIVVIKRSGGDGTEFPLTGTCLFGRVAECDIRIQLPHVSKEHCRIDLNENKEVVLTNLSSTNPTCVNGEALQQSERLKNGDVITIIDRSFRFEYPPAPTPKKRSSRGGLTETLKVHQDQQVGDKVSTEVSTDPHLKDGTNQENIQRSLDKTMEVEPKQDSSLQQSKTASPFGDLYQMIKQSLDVKTPRKSSASVLQTPTSRFCTPRPVSVRGNEGKAVISTEDKSTPQKEEAKVPVVAEETKEAENVSQSAKKQRRSFQTPSTEMAAAENAAQSEETTPQKRVRTPPQRFTCEESPVRRRSKEATPAVTKEQEETSPITEKVKEKSKKRKSGEVVSDMPGPDMKRKRVSFGGTLCPELFDKRLPPDSPLRKGATPRVSKTKNSLLRRASASGLLEFEDEESPAKKKTPAKKSPKSRTPSPKTARGRSSSVGGSPEVLAPSVQGRFSVSRIITPSPGAEDVVPVAPKVTQRRRSTSRDTQSGATLMRRRSGISRASMKVNNSWADIVRFGPTKHQVFAPVIHMVTKKTTKAAVPNPQTPARNIMGHVSTGHADSPVTIVVGRAQQRVVPTGAAPRLVPNLALLKKNMKMDEDFTGISELLKTPAVKKRSVINENNALKTPVGASVVEPSVLNTPEESGEMMVSPLTVSSSVKSRSYNSEAVQRLLNDEAEESSCISEVPVSSEQQCTDLKKTSATTPKQKPELPECLTEVKRIKKTPKQKSEPIEDLRGKILKTPKQKREQQEDCLTGVKQMMATPKQEAVEDIKVELLTTPSEKVEQQESIAVVEVVCETPQKEAEPIVDLQENVLETPKAPEAEATRVDDVEETEETPVQESEEPSETTDMLSASSVAPAELEDLTRDETVDYTCCEVKAKEPEDDVPSDVQDVPEVNMEKADANDVVDDIESSDAAKTVSEAPVDEIVAVEEPKMETVVDDVSEEPEVVTVDEKVTEEQPMEDAVETVSEEKVDTVEETASEEPKVETASEIVTEMDTASSKPDQKKKSVRGRRTKTVEPEEADGQQEAVEQSEEPVIPTPSRGRRVKNTEAAASSAVKQIKRGRDAKSEESQDVELPVEESEPLPTKAAPKPKRGSSVKKASEVQEVPLVSATNTLKRVGKGKQAAEEPEAEEKSEEEPAPVRKSRGAKKEVAQAVPAKKARRGAAPTLEETSEESTVSEPAPAPVEPVKKGRRAAAKPATVTSEPENPTEDSSSAVQVDAKTPKKKGKQAAVEPEEKPEPEAEEKSEEEPAPVRKSRGAKKEVGLAASVKKTRRGAAPTLEETSEESTVSEPAPVEPVKKGRRAAAKPATVTSEPENPTEDASSAVQEDAKTPKRKGKQAAVEPEAEEKSEEEPAPVRKSRGAKKEVAQAVPVKKARRGAAPTLEETIEESTVSEPAPAPVEPVKKGRRAAAKPATVTSEPENPTEDSSSAVQEDAKTPKRKGKQAAVEPEEKPEAEEKSAEEPAPVRKSRGAKKEVAQAVPAKKARRGAAPTLEDTSEESTVSEPAPIEPVKKGRRAAAKPATVTSEPENPTEDASSAVQEDAKTPKKKRTQAAVEPEAEEKSEEEPASVRKSRGAKKEVAQAVPVKKARRGAAPTLEETSEESTVSEPAPAPVESVKKGRRAAAKPATVTSEPENPTEDSSSAVQEDAKTSKRSVKWNADVEALEVPKATPVKAVRGRKSKLCTKTVSMDADKTEEKDLSDKVVEAAPVKRAKRVAKVVVETADEAETSSKVESVETEAQPKPRRARVAKK
ncbi:proliferation marker protein Ki-67 isoform X1 [Pseudochaenichthys georgianus]|uniref:proliferation marker protein Ki-67 isoform X1 n=1 Tax=Pseudochaenichthys georgianus TaxID=52239 RepID=UPI00146E8DD6|nr:proliferation marker protein Ki-67 isoform X2 [Pseudochaenichthys georgianus]